MSTENEGNENDAVPSVPSVPSVPPVPAAAPEGTPPESGLPGAPVSPASPEDAPTAQVPPVHPESDPGHSSSGERGPSPEQAYAQSHGQPQQPAQPPAPAQPPLGPAAWPPPPPAVPSYADAAGAQPWGAPVAPEAKPPRKRRAGGLVVAVAVAALVAGGIGGALGYRAADGGASGSTTVAAANSPKDFKRADGTIASVAAKALPSVVTIDAQSGDGEGGTGTGFVYDKEGHILTNNHVVASAADSGQLTATFSDGKKYDAEVVGRAQGYDVAVLKLKDAPDGLTPLPLGDSDKVAVGDSTIAIGAPFGLSNTVTTGIISAKNRPVASGDGSSNKNSYMSALQTDASINPGNSGGPLLDAGGAVIGINSAIQSTTGGGIGQSQAGSIGLGFAIPVNQAKNVAEQLIKTGQPVYPVIGATVTMEEKSGGAVISDEGAGGTPAVTPDGPAAKAGLKAGDVITKFNDKAVDSGPTLIGEIWTHKPGDKVTLTYERDGRTATADVVLGERKGDS
ncbi:PDZ domain-containing protein [Streptomyces nitrosporeus]|uniref:PDZ domain-containing protein n=1 Tax=Streptomyces nitrosporeus TaxID=28894 RepID=A0A5J6FBH1_9ACTN|nr:trypsin-like peptidase domain-containing protein [Streptomyces nitrosporeus]QEU73396.1 PDZ domain-containing protein [Streptomyces nitrosporeus]GGZ04968.1 protease [Streptomyces nitrosporeus]